MPSEKHSLVFLSATFLVALTSQSSNAFTIRQCPNIGDSFAISNFGNSIGITTLNAADPVGDAFPSNFFRLSVSPIKRGGTKGLLRDLNLYVNEG